MTEFSYIYNITNDFSGTTGYIDISHINLHIKDILSLKNISYVSNDDTDVTIVFSVALSSLEETSVTSYINSYFYVPDYIPSKLKYETFVSNDPNIKGNYTSIRDAFEAGHKSVFVKGNNSSSYYETGDIIIPCEGQIYGENSGNVTIDFGGGAFSVKTSSFVCENSGIISVTNGSSIVTGITGTTFTSMSSSLSSSSEKVYILLGSQCYPVLSIESDSSLTISKIFNGKTGDLSVYEMGLRGKKIKIQNLNIENSTSTGLYLGFTLDSYIENVTVINCVNNIIIKDCVKTFLNDIYTHDSNGNGIIIKDSVNTMINFCVSFNNSENGLLVNSSENSVRNLNIESGSFEHNKFDGIKIGTGVTGENKCKLVSITNSIIKYNNGSGIVIINNPNDTLDSCGHIISNSEISNNGIHGIDSDGMYCRISGNAIGYHNQNGVNLKNMDCNFEGNLICSNNKVGVSIVTGADRQNICDNVIKENGGNGLNIIGASCINVSANILFGNTGNGIFIDSSSSSDIISSNLIEINGGDGINLYDASYVNINGNNIKTNGGTGIKCRDLTTTKCLITSNICINNTIAQIVDENVSSDLIITNNII